LENKPKNVEELNALTIKGTSIAQLVVERIGITGEKMEIGAYEYLSAPTTVAYIHPGNKLSTIVGLNQANVDVQVVKDIAMQVAAMNPVAVSKIGVSQEIIDRELKIGREKAQEQGKPAAMLDKIAEGALIKYFQENTLLAQAFIKDVKITVEQYLQKQNKELAVVDFKRVTLNVD